METNKKTDWQQFLVINSWRLHLSLRAHMNYIVAVWAFKRSDVINLFRVTMGSVWSQGFFTCGIAVLQPHLQDTFCSCPEGAARGKEGCGQASLSSIFLRGSSLCMHWDQKLSSVPQQVRHECHTDPYPAWASWEALVQLQLWLSQPALPRPQWPSPQSWNADRKTPPLLLP